MTLTPETSDRWHDADDAEFLRRVIDATRDGIMVARAIRDRSGEIADFEMIFLNQVLQDMLEPGADWVGHRLRRDLPNTLEDGRYQILVDAIHSGTPQSAELATRFRSGSANWLSVSATPRGDQVVVSIRNVTQERDAAAALAESEQRYRELVEHQAELVCRFLPDSTIVFANEAFARYHGHEPETLVGQRMLDLLPPGRREPAAIVIGSLTPDNPTVTDEGYLIAPDGTQRWQQWTTAAVVEDGTITEIQAVGIDITDRKRAEIAVRARSEVLDLVNRVSQRFIDLEPDEVAPGIDAALADIGEALDVDRTYLVLYGDDGRHLEMAHEWCADGVDSVRAMVTGLPDDAMPAMKAALRRGESVAVQSVAALGDDWTAEREAYRHTGVKTVLVMPVIDGGRLIGSVGVDLVREERELSEDEIAILGSAAVSFGQVLARRDAEVEVRRSERRFRALVAGVPDLLVRVDADGVVLDWRPPIDAGGRWSVPQIIGSPLEATAPELAAAVRRARAADHDGTPHVEAVEVDLDGASVSLEARITIAGQEAIALVRDITEQRRLQLSLLHQATHDALTGLANRRLFSEHLDAALAHGRHGGGFPAVLFVDLDRFKVLNDSQGHDVGDTVLRVAATRISQAVRPGDVVARLGGDEFAVLSHRVGSVGDAVAMAERIVSVVSRPIEADGDSVVITASIGVVVAAGDSTTASVLRDADAAMYEAKARGRQRVEVFTDDIRMAALVRHQVEHDLRRALDLDQLVLHYQPLWSLSHRRWVGAEALVRWQHPQRGLLAPAQFLPVALDAGLMPALGAWVLDRAADEVAQWHSGDSRPLRVWVNLSAEQLTSLTLVADVVDAVERHGIDPTQLGVEVTETALMGDLNVARSNLGRLRALGIGVALDDFGTGLSSLTHLDSLPLDVVKLDGAFVSGASTAGRQRDLVDGIVRLLRRLGVEVLAERVEDPVEVAALRDLGVDTLQGYYLGRPMAVGSLVTFLLDDPEV